MSNLNLLIVEGNIKKDTETFIKAAGTSVSENFRKLIKVFEPECKIDIIEPGNDLEVQKTISKIKDYDGVIFAGGAMRINDQTEEIKKHISFAKECFKSGKKILAVCWGLQVCTVAAGGKVNTGKNGPHVGIATDVKINESGKKHKIYISKKNVFTTPAFNFDEVSELPNNSTILANNYVNKVMALHINVEQSEVWGIQYHPDYYYKYTINLTKLRTKKLLENKRFNNQEDLDKHISYIKEEEKILDFDNRTQEVRNWINYIKNE